MISAGTIAAPESRGARQRIAGFTARASFGTARLAPEDLESLQSCIASGTPIYVGAVPARPAIEQVDTAAAIAAAGFDPVPHIAVRSFAGVADLDCHLGRLVDAAGIRRVLVVGGDYAQPAGPFHAAVEAIESGLLQARGIVEIGIAGYPDGHPWLPVADLDRALAAKIEAAAETGLAVHIVTQFGFASATVLAWIARLRDLGIDHPVRVGVAGPATLASLMRHARICGVTASAQDLASHAGLGGHAFGMITPDRLLRSVAQAPAGLGDVAPHIYAFGRLGPTVRWTASVAAAHFVLGHADGFAIEPP